MDLQALQAKYVKIRNKGLLMADENNRPIPYWPDCLARPIFEEVAKKIPSS